MDIFKGTDKNFKLWPGFEDVYIGPDAEPYFYVARERYYMGKLYEPGWYPFALTVQIRRKTYKLNELRKRFFKNQP